MVWARLVEDWAAALFFRETGILRRVLRRRGFGGSRNCASAPIFFLLLGFGSSGGGWVARSMNLPVALAPFHPCVPAATLARPVALPAVTRARREACRTAGARSRAAIPARRTLAMTLCRKAIYSLAVAARVAVVRGIVMATPTNSWRVLPAPFAYSVGGTLSGVPFGHPFTISQGFPRTWCHDSPSS